MSLRIRLTRVGRRNAAAYRVVVTEKRSKRDGRIVEAVGHYNPHLPTQKTDLDRERIAYWISKGAEPSLTVGRLLKEKV